MTRDNPRAKQITEVLTQFIVLDDQPLSVVDNVGFRRFVNVLEPKYEIPSRRHVTDIVLDAHWIDGDFPLQQIMLHAKQFRGSHSGLAIASVFEEMLATWAIPKSSVHVVVRDNAKNMVKGMEEAGVSSLPCVAHTLQMAVTEGLLSQRSVTVQRLWEWDAK